MMSAELFIKRISEEIMYLGHIKKREILKSPCVYHFWFHLSKVYLNVWTLGLISYELPQMLHQTTHESLQIFVFKFINTTNFEY